MRNRHVIAFILVLIIFLFAFRTQVAIIVDTGLGSIETGGVSLFSEQWLAVEFSTSQTWEITDVQGWISASFPGGAVTFALYTDGGEIPGTELFSQTLSIDPAFFSDWHGPSGLSWIVTPGTFWLAFEVRSGSSFDGAMQFPSTTPLINGAVAFPSTGWLDAQEVPGIGVRILGEEANATPVPEPASLLLIGSGLFGLFARGRRRK